MFSWKKHSDVHKIGLWVSCWGKDLGENDFVPEAWAAMALSRQFGWLISGLIWFDMFWSEVVWYGLIWEYLIYHTEPYQTILWFSKPWYTQFSVVYYGVICVFMWFDAIHGTNDNNLSKWFGVNRLGSISNGSSDLIPSTRDLKPA